MHIRDEPRARIAPGIGAVQPIHVRQQHQAIRADHLRDPRGQPVVVAVANLCRRDGVVLVDHGNRAEAQQRAEGIAGIQIAPALLGVAERQQNLRHAQPMQLQRILPGVRQADLADGRRGLLLFQLEPRRRQAELSAPECDRARGHQQHFLPAGTNCSHVRCQRLQPGAVRGTLLRIHQQRRADFDHDAARAQQRQGRQRVRSGIHGACHYYLNLECFAAEKHRTVQGLRTPGGDGAPRLAVTANAPNIPRPVARRLAFLRCLRGQRLRPGSGTVVRGSRRERGLPGAVGRSGRRDHRSPVRERRHRGDGPRHLARARPGARPGAGGLGERR